MDVSFIVLLLLIVRNLTIHAVILSPPFSELDAEPFSEPFNWLLFAKERRLFSYSA